MRKGGQVQMLRQEPARCPPRRVSTGGGKLVAGGQIGGAGLLHRGAAGGSRVEGACMVLCMVEAPLRLGQGVCLVTGVARDRHSLVPNEVGSPAFSLLALIRRFGTEHFKYQLYFLTPTFLSLHSCWRKTSLLSLWFPSPLEVSRPKTVGIRKMTELASYKVSLSRTPSSPHTHTDNNIDNNRAAFITTEC